MKDRASPIDDARSSRRLTLFAEEPAQNSAEATERTAGAAELSTGHFRYVISDLAVMVAVENRRQSPDSGYLPLHVRLLALQNGAGRRIGALRRTRSREA